MSEIEKAKPKQLSSENIQYELFSQFVSNDPTEMSNSVDFWEGIPKYFFTPKLMEKLREKNGLANPYKWDFEHQGTGCSIKIQPALIEQANGSYKAFFPGVTEELIEEALKKILTDQRYGLHDPVSYETWVRFTLRMISKELKARGRSRSITEIKKAINIMSGCNITYYKDGKEVWSGSILQDLVTVGREEYKEDANSHHIARLPLFISHGINALEYRQHSHKRLMELSDQLARWIFKTILIPRYTQASMINNFHYMYSRLKRSGLLQQQSEAGNRRKALDAHEQLVEKGVLSRFEVDEVKEGRKIIDVKYTLFPTPEFVIEQKAANRRAKNNREIAEKKAILPAK
jgi:hypothetical protein